MTAALGRIAIIGCGQIGGSLGLALAGQAERIGFDPGAGDAVVGFGICDRVAATAADAVAGADAVVVAVPLADTAAVIEAIRPAVRADAIVTDVGSTKLSAVAAGERAFGGRFVGGHPWAGTERSGPSAANAALFRGRRVLLTPTERTEAAALAWVRALWTAAGAGEVILLPAADHDELAAAVSHLPHVSAYALTLAIGGMPDAIAARMPGLYGGGFIDTTRIASSDPAMWTAIFLDNRERVLEMTRALGASLARLTALIEARDEAGIQRMLEEARVARARIIRD